MPGNHREHREQPAGDEAGEEERHPSGDPRTALGCPAWLVVPLELADPGWRHSQAHGARNRTATGLPLLFEHPTRERIVSQSILLPPRCSRSARPAQWANGPGSGAPHDSCAGDRRPECESSGGILPLAAATEVSAANGHNPITVEGKARDD